jgi:hypothetical protein
LKISTMLSMKALVEICFSSILFDGDTLIIFYLIEPNQLLLQ